MVVVRLIPREENVVGTSLAGSDNEKKRDYTLAYSNPYSKGIEVRVNGVFLHLGADWTYDAGKIVFENQMRDSDVITITYYNQLALAT